MSCRGWASNVIASICITSRQPSVFVFKINDLRHTRFLFSSSDGRRTWIGTRRGFLAGPSPAARQTLWRSGSLECYLAVHASTNWGRSNSRIRMSKCDVQSQSLPQYREHMVRFLYIKVIGLLHSHYSVWYIEPPLVGGSMASV